jgi:hypothetical protein
MTEKIFFMPHRDCKSRALVLSWFNAFLTGVFAKSAGFGLGIDFMRIMPLGKWRKNIKSFDSVADVAHGYHAIGYWQNGSCPTRRWHDYSQENLP